MSAEMTPQGIRVNCVHPGLIDTPMTEWVMKDKEILPLGAGPDFSRSCRTASRSRSGRRVFRLGRSELSHWSVGPRGRWVGRQVETFCVSGER